MKSQIELINHYSKELIKVIESHGPDSDYTDHAFFALKAAKMGVKIENINVWARNETKRLHHICLDMI